MSDFPHAAPNPWTRLERRTVYENPWITLYHDEVLRPDRQPGIYGVVHYRNHAVGVVPIDADDRVLLVGQNRYALDLYSWEIPEGGAPFGEDLLEAAQRELREETGYSAASWQPIIHGAHLSNCVSDEAATIFLATELTPGAAAPDPTEDLQVRWVPFAEALRMTLAGEITDAMSLLGLQRVALMRGKRVD